MSQSVGPAAARQDKTRRIPLNSGRKEGFAMKRLMSAVVIIAACGAAFAAEPSLTLSPTGYGPYKIGLPIDVLERVARAKLPYNPYNNHGCSLVSSLEFEPQGIVFMIDKKRLTRINLDFFGTDPRPLLIKTDTGIGLRSSEEDLLKAYAGRTRIDKNALDPNWHTIYVDEPDRLHTIIFETDGRKVKSIRLGEYPDVSNPAGCN
jgi:hypothetical protein